VHPEKFAGKSFQDKISELRKELEKKKTAGFVICTRPSRTHTPNFVTNMYCSYA
jgi:hypothetical protein